MPPALNGSKGILFIPLVSLSELVDKNFSVFLKKYEKGAE
jgi:hypothetical protein